jgi:hypothetical protein
MIKKKKSIIFFIITPILCWCILFIIKNTSAGNYYNIIKQ